ncbi:MAG TPA: superoxide dismutase [Bacteroidia bacterium]|nr:superoxide dismutase [Bacteroidia bacterium]
MKIYAIDRILPTATEEKIRGVVIREALHTWILYSKELIREVYFRKDRPGVIIALECANVEEARNILSTFPMVRSGVIDFDIIPVGHFVPFGTLFDQELLKSVNEQNH